MAWHWCRRGSDTHGRVNHGSTWKFRDVTACICNGEIGGNRLKASVELLASRAVISRTMMIQLLSNKKIGER